MLSWPVCEHKLDQRLLGNAPISVVCIWLGHFQLLVGFPRQEYYSGLPLPLSGELLDPGIKPTSLTSPALAGGFFTTFLTYHVLSAPAECLAHGRHSVKVKWLSRVRLFVTPWTPGSSVHGIF